MNNRSSHYKSYDPCYRSRRGMAFGVCRGIADRFGISLFWLRVIVVVSTFMSGIFPGLIVYGVAALVMKPEPAMPMDSDADVDFYMTYSSNRKLATSRLNRQFRALEDRIQRMESAVTDKEFLWEQRLRTNR